MYIVYEVDASVNYYIRCRSLPMAIASRRLRQCQKMVRLWSVSKAVYGFCQQESIIGVGICMVCAIRGVSSVPVHIYCQCQKGL